MVRRRSLNRRRARIVFLPVLGLRAKDEGGAMSSRDDAVRVGADDLDTLMWSNPRDSEIHARRVLDAAQKAGLVSYEDEWEQVEVGRTEDAYGYEVFCVDVEPGSEVFVRRVAGTGKGNKGVGDAT
jgi:hypothetical protein